MISLKNEQDIEAMRQGGRILARVLKMVVKEVKADLPIAKLDDLAEGLIRLSGCLPAFQGYTSAWSGHRPYPNTLCVSVNDEVVHGVASRPKILCSGDIVGLDIGLKYPGQTREYFLDMAVTVGVGRVSDSAQRLMKVTKRALWSALRIIRPGIWLEDISRTIQSVLQSGRLGIIRDLTGHGVGYQLHEDPYIPNLVSPDFFIERVRLKQGMTLAIEPMATLGDWKVMEDQDGWTIRTQDRSLAAQFEHTVVVTENGCEILTRES